MRYLFLFLLVCSSVSAKDIYVRPDGGSPTQCDGSVDTALSSTGHCAISHPMYVLPPDRDGGDGNLPALMIGGDVLHIAVGQYQMGYPVGKATWNSCNGSYVWDCHMRAVPSGTAAQHTKIIGAGSTLTQLWASGGSYVVVNLTGSNYVDISGLEITDHSNCIQNHPVASIKCADGNTGALWGAIGVANTLGAADAPASSNITLTDINVHGMAKYGALIGHNTNLVVSSSKFNANGLGGISTDTGPSPSGGVNTFTNIEIGNNGCTENYPATTLYGCWGQNSNPPGYGDGFGASSASDTGSWTFTQVSVHDNTQDGIDFLHGSPSILLTYDHVTAVRNAGNQLKTNGAAKITYSIIIGNCSTFVGVGSMIGDNTKSGASSGDQCRAFGDPIQAGQVKGLTTLIDHNTIIGEGNDLVTVPSTGFGDATSKLVLSNNIFIGQKRWVKNDGSYTTIYWWGDTNPLGPPIMTGNWFWQVDTGPCPVGNTCADPKLTDERLASFDPTPTSSSPADAGAFAGGGAIVTPTPTACTPIIKTCSTTINGATSVTTCQAACK